jgi:hypothetical protein
MRDATKGPSRDGERFTKGFASSAPTRLSIRLTGCRKSDASALGGGWEVVWIASGYKALHPPK